MVKWITFCVIFGCLVDSTDGVPPVFTNVATDGSTRVTVLEDSPVSSVVITLLATDADGDTLTFTIVNIDGVAPPGLDFNNVADEIRVNSVLDFETKTTYVIQVRVSDGTTDVDGIVTINIGDINDNSPVITGTLAVNVDEEQAVGTVVPFSITVTDGDAGDTTFFTLTGLHATFFQIYNGDGTVAFAQKLDRDMAAAIIVFDQLTLTVTDSVGNTGSVGLTVALLDINDNSPQCSPSSYFTMVTENSPVNTAVQTLTCTDDDDPPNGNVVLSIVGGDDALAKFSVTGFNIATTANPIDYETLGGQSYQYNLIVDVIDGGAVPRTGTATIIVTVTPVNEAAPAWAAFSPVYNPLTPYAVFETIAVGSTVVTIAATDTDNGLDGVVSYELVTVLDDSGILRAGIFILDASTGVLTTLKSLDRDTGTGGVAHYKVTVRAKDSGTPVKSVIRVLTIDITDTNDIAPVFSATSYPVTIPESSVFGSSVVQVLATDLDETATTIVYEIEAGDPLNSFSYSTTTSGLMEVNNNIDLDIPISKPYIYVLRIIARDSGTPELTGTASVIITVTPQNELTPIFGATSPGATVLIGEDTVPGTSVATVTATDGDYGQDGVITFTITAGNTNTAFTIDGTTGVIQTVVSLDFETVNSYKLKVTATDGGIPALSASTTVTVSVTDINENAPTCSAYSIVVTVAEDAAINDPVAALVCTDDDTSDVLAYSITNGNGDNRFTLDAVTGSLTLANTLNYENINSYTISVDIIDQASPVKTTTAQILIQVGPVNEFDPVFAVGGYTATVPENIAVLSNVLVVIATDSDQGTSHGTPRYSIINGDGLGQFTVDSASGQITTVKTLNREAIASYNLLVRATDSTPGAGDERSADTTVFITVTDINDNPPIFTPMTQNIYIQETAPVGSIPVSFVANDDDTGANANLVYSIFLDPSGLFGINGNGLMLTSALDYETATTHTVIVQAVDGGMPVLTGTATVTVNVLSTNDNTPVFTIPNAATTINESTPVGTSIFDAKALDNDVGTGSTISYYIISGNDPSNNTYFIDPSLGQLFLWSQLDFDTPPQTYNLTLKAEDSGGLFDTMWLAITLTDVNDEYPIFTNYTYYSAVYENMLLGSLVIQVQATDNDYGTNGQVSYSIVSGDGQTSFSITSNTGDISTLVALDYEVKTLYNLVIQGVDGGTPQLTSSCLVIISINDINDNPPVFSPVDFTVNIAEDATVGTSVTIVNAKDADSAANSNNIFNYFLNDTFFEVHPLTGTVTSQAALDRETQSKHILSLQAVNSGLPPLTGTATVTVVLDDVNDNSPVITGIYDRSIMEDTSVGTILFTVAATDADVGDNGKLDFSIVTGNTGGDFKIDADAGFVQVQNTLDRETTAVYMLQIRVRDNVLIPNAKYITVTLTIADVNDNDPIFTGTPYTFNIAENEIVGTLAGTLVATDADTGINANRVFSLLNFWTGDPSHFVVDGITGQITSKVLLDRESIASYFVWCKVQDGGSPSRATYTNVTISVTDKNDNYPMFDSTAYSVTTVEGSTMGISVLGLTVTDKDIGVNGDYTLTIDTTTADGALADTYFTIDTTIQTISVKAVIDREATPSFSFSVLAVDKGSPALTASASVIVTVLDVNDNAPVFNTTFYNSEVAYAGQCTNSILTVSATDLDAGNNGQVIYYLVQSSYDHLFSMDPQTGILSLKSTATTNFNYILVGRARDNGLPLQISTIGTILRVDSFTPNEYVISFNLKISRTDFLVKYTEFLAQLKNLISVKYPDARVSIWCIEERAGTPISPPTRRRLLAINPVSIHVYVLKDNTTDVEANKDLEKKFLSYDESLSFFTTDPNGSPSSALTGSNWNYYSIETITPYQETTTPWQDTDGGIAVITVTCLVLLLLIIILFYLCFRRYRQKQRLKTPPNTMKKNEFGKPIKVLKSEVPDLDQNQKKHPPPAVLSLPMPAESQLVPKKRYNEDFFWNVAPVSTRENRLNSTTPLTEIDSGSYIFNNRQFDGMAVDQDTGLLYEYNTKTNQRKWLHSSVKPARVGNLVV